MYKGSHSIRDVVQCKSNTIKKRCRKRTAHTPKCWIHLSNEDKLCIKPSNIKNAGKGLFSWKKPIKCKQFIVEYTGEKTMLKKLDNRYGVKTVAQYTTCDGPKRCWDAYKTTHGAPRFANDAGGTKKIISVENIIIRVENNNEVFLRVTTIPDKQSPVCFVTRRNTSLLKPLYVCSGASCDTGIKSNLVFCQKPS